MNYGKKSIETTIRNL